MSKRASTTFWHPFADMSAVNGHELVVASGQGARVRTQDGREYIDASAALWFNSVGHGRRELADAAAAQMMTLAAYSNFGDQATEPTLRLSDRLSALSPQEDCKVFFTSGGSDAVDTAVKMVRRYWWLKGQPDRTWIITRNRAYHGMHMAGTALAGIPANRDGYGDLDSRVRNVQWDSAAELATVIDELGAEHVGAFFCEPVIGAGGIYAPPPGYLDEVRAICRDRGVLFVADEVITGYGRVGSMFASTRWALDPDLILTAKGLTSGYLPMGAVLVAGRIAEPFWNSPGVMWRHGYTYSGHATAAAVAMANLDVLERERLVERVVELQPVVARLLQPLSEHDAVHEVRAGVGLLGAVQVKPDVLAADPTFGPRLIGQLRERGVLTRMLADGSVQVSPPFVIGEDDLASIALAIDESLASLGSIRRARPTLDVNLLPDQTSDEAGGFGSSDDRLLADVPPHHGG
ncbi:MAG: aspartate aminotransferase family protein [Candidatus Nanopelagicales bacterium]